MIGRTLSQFKVTAKLGSGGMGEVYRAHCSKLGRDVAIKVLPPAFTQDPERLARFEREARVLASIEHPNIATLYEIGQSDEVRFLAMQLVEGSDLTEVLSRGPLPVDEAVSVALQIVQALEAAHDRGIVHRDLKPGNVKIGAAGQVKVLDFGLAKSVGRAGSAGSDDDSPTITANMTQEGAVLGTPAYMSPEQARGQPVDKRSDIWSLGCVLWECLTGEVLFGGPTTSDSIGAVLRKEPDWRALPEETPPGVRRLLRRCLTKDPRQRLHHIADARLELEDTDPAPPVTVEPKRGQWVAVAAAVLASLMTAFLYFSRPVAGTRAAGSENPLAGAKFSRLTDFPGSEFDASISPDGKFVAFVSDRDGQFEIFIGQIGVGGFRKVVAATDLPQNDARAPVTSVGFSGDGSEVWLHGGPWRRVQALPLLGGPLRNYLGENVVTVVASPDNQEIVYHERLAGDPLFVAARNGTQSRKILGPPAGTHQHYPVWATDGEWIYVVRGRPATLEMDLWRLRKDGEGLEQMTFGKLDVQFPSPLDDRTVLYSARDSDGSGPWIWALDVETKESRRASVGLEQYDSVSASADGRRLVATVQDSAARLSSVPILDGVATESDIESLDGISTRRALSPRFGGSSLFYLSSRGSGDGLWRLRDGGASEIWRGSETALLEPAAVSPDGETLVLLLRRAEGWRLHTLKADGTGLELLSDLLDARGEASWSPDGRWIVSGGFVDGVEGLFKIPVDGGAVERILKGEALNPVWSPRGDLIVYTGAQVTVVSPLNGVRPNGEVVDLPELQVFRFGQRARFLPDGSGLVYMQGAGNAQDFWLLDIETMKSRPLTRLDQVETMRTFDITPDGKRIVFDRLSEGSDIVLIELQPRPAG